MELSNPKVLVIGLDGATFDLINPWIMQGKLPFLSQCIKKGVTSHLLSTPLSNSAQAWSTFVTGKNPGKHGIFDFVERIPESYDVRFVNASFRRGQALWDLVSEAKKEVIGINVPMSYPPEEVRGIILSGLDAPGMVDNFAYPPDIMEEIRKNVGQYVLEPGIWGYIRRGKHGTALRRLLETIRIRTETATYLMRTYPWDLFMVVFTESDKVQHHFWKYMGKPGPFESAILTVYQELDRSIGELLQLVDDQTRVYIISDHGAGPSTRRTFYINKWLNHEGFLQFKKPTLKKNFLSKAIRQADVLIKTRIPRRGKELLVRCFPRIRSKVESFLCLSTVDWFSTKAYSLENHPAIFINIKGREPLGVVKPGGDYYKVRKAVASRLKSLMCPETGEKIVSQVLYREDLFWGEETEKAPDIVFRWKDNRYIHRPSAPDSGDGHIKILSDREMDISESFDRPSGVHRDEGIFIALGPEVRSNKRLPLARLMDVAPTILHGLRIPIPNSMDGEVLVDIFSKDFIGSRPIVYRDQTHTPLFPKASQLYNADEEAVIRERLKGLGYID